MPEKRFLEDRRHQGIRNLLTYQGGRSEVVWAGVGTYPLGRAEMEVLTGEIAATRATKLNAQKLSGIKPYSKHGF